MLNKIYQKESTLYGYLDTIYYFFYNISKEKLLDIDSKYKADIMVEYNCRTHNITFYITVSTEPIVERRELISADINYFLDKNIYIHNKIRRAIKEIKRHNVWNNNNKEE